MMRSNRNPGPERWIIQRGKEYLVGESFVDGIQPIFAEDYSRAVRYDDKDFAEMIQFRYGRKVVCVTPAIAQAV